MAATTKEKENTMRLIPTGHALSIFLAITFTLCIAWGLVAPPSLHMHGAWEQLLPGFEFISVSSFFLGLIESYVYGWYIALVFVPLYRLFNRQIA